MGQPDGLWVKSCVKVLRASSSVSQTDRVPAIWGMSGSARTVSAREGSARLSRHAELPDVSEAVPRARRRGRSSRGDFMLCHGRLDERWVGAAGSTLRPLACDPPPHPTRSSQFGLQSA